MSEPEERLTDALKDVGETVQPRDVPPQPFPDRPRSALSRPLVPTAVIAAFVLLLGGVAVGYLVVDRTSGDRGAQNAAASAERRVSVFLCTRMSSNRSCARGDATEQQKEAIKRLLQDMPRVRQVHYESKEEAFRNFKKRFADDKRIQQGVEPGDIPDSFRVQVAKAEDAKAVKAAMDGVPGVDTVIIEPRSARA